MMVVCAEMQKLREWLDEKNIKWEDRSQDWSHLTGAIYKSMPSHWMVRTHFFINDNLVAIINGFGTIGGYHFQEEENEGLLQFCSALYNHGESIGSLNADSVIEIIEGLLSKEEENEHDNK